MKTIILAAALLAPCAASATEYGIEAQKRAIACTWASLTGAVNGDFSRVVLPDFIKTRHMRAGQFLDDTCTPR